MNPTSPSNSTRTIRCAGCGQDNPADRKFCGQCGGRLWQSCLECDSINAIDENFCGGCGVKLADSIQGREDELKAKLQLAIKLEEEGRYFDAASKLREVSAGNDERLMKYQENASQLLDQLDDRRKVRTVESEQLATQARVYHRQQEYVKAFESLKAIPVGLRNMETTNFMIEVEGLFKEISELTDSIRKALKAKTYQGLIPQVERLCHLQPKNEDAKKLLVRLGKQKSEGLQKQANTLASLAKKRMGEQRYRNAAEAVAKIDPKHRKGPVDQIYRTATELGWCLDKLKSSTVATDMLLNVASRWQRLAPKDTRAAELHTQLSKRLKTRPKDRRFLLPTWTPHPPESTLGAPIKMWNGIGHSEVDQDALKALQEFPGQFMVAYGLALQGIGKGTLNHDLNPKKGSWSRLLSRKKKSGRIWGLDIGSTSVKALELSYDATDETLDVLECLVFPHAKPLHSIQDDEAVAEVVSGTIEQFVEATAAKKPRVAVGFPGRLGLARFFDLPPIKSKKTKLGDAVRFEIKHQIPIPIDEAAFDFHAWEPVGDGFVELRPIVSVAARKEDMQDWVAPVVSAGCDVALLQCDGFALFNAAYHEFVKHQSDSAGFAVIDVGGDATNLVVCERNYVWMRAIVHGTKRWDDAIVRDLPVNRSQSEKLRKDPSRAKWMHQVTTTLDKEFSQLREDLKRSINGYPKTSEPGIKLVLGTGGGFSQFGLLQHLVHGEKLASEQLR